MIRRSEDDACSCRGPGEGVEAKEECYRGEEGERKTTRNRDKVSWQVRREERVLELS